MYENKTVNGRLVRVPEQKKVIKLVVKKSPHTNKRKSVIKFLNINQENISNKKLARLIREYTGKYYTVKSPKRVVRYFYDYYICDKKPLKLTVPKQKFVQTDGFLRSPQWRRLRVDALENNNGCCELCGRNKHDGIKLNVDHIKPRKTNPELALEISNLQILCNECNAGKGNRYETDWRKV